MNVRVLFVLLLLGILLAFTSRYRRVGLAMCAAIAGLLLVTSIREAEHPEPDDQAASNHASARSTTSVAMPRAQLGAMHLDGRGAPWRLRGSVQNLSDNPIRSVTLNIERYSCPTASDAQADCVSQWQGVHILQVSISAHATVTIDESFYSHVAVPLQTGVVRDQITITNVE